MPDQSPELSQSQPLPQPTRPWIVLGSTYDVEAWIDNYNRDLQQTVKKDNAKGSGICFLLELGGEIYLHTTSEGDILLDVSEDAAWVGPLISAATTVAAPPGPVWALPGDTLTQLILGLSGLISATRMVISHTYKMPKSWPRHD
jgi:hypothetical protein